MGELIVDHRASPGFTEEIARLVGYDPKQVAEGKKYEVKTLRCSHCGGCAIPNFFRTRPRALCLECNNIEGHYICDACDYLRHQAGYVHRPFEAKIDEELKFIAMGSPPKLIMP
jgi:hypothetical protein